MAALDYYRYVNLVNLVLKIEVTILRLHKNIFVKTGAESLY